MVMPFASGDTVVVNVGDTLGFSPSASATTSGALTITNLTDSSAVLGTPTYSLTVTSSDVSATPVTWATAGDIGYMPYGADGTSDVQVIAGINVPVNLSLTFTGSGAGLFYQKSGAGWVLFTTGTTVSFVNGDTLEFSARLTALGTSSGVITVTNLSDSSAVVGTCNYFVKVSAGAPP